jgi:hypothetical protein
MDTPFDEIIADVKQRDYHNQRKELHSDKVSEGVLRDLLRRCEPLRTDYIDEVVEEWFNVSAPGTRGRRIDLLIAEPLPETDEPDLSKTRLAMENKSVITAHRNKTSRYDDLSRTMKAIHDEQEAAVMVGTVMIGTAKRVLNVPDLVKKFINEAKFQKKVRPRLSTGDAALWNEFDHAISKNSSNDPGNSVEKFRELPTRRPGHTHDEGYDFLMLAPVFIDNVNPPRVERKNSLGINVDHDYKKMIQDVCRAYSTRWDM